MGEPTVILALRRKRDSIETAVAGYERKIKEAQANLAHVTASLRLFELSGDPSEFLAYIDLNRILRRGEFTHICMGALKAEGPLDTRELTSQVMAANGLNRDDRVLAQAISPCGSSRASGSRHGVEGRWTAASGVRGPVSGGLEPKLIFPRYRRMSQNRPREDGYADKLLAIAAGWQKRAGRATDPYHGDVMRRAVEELERAAARAKSQAPPKGDFLEPFQRSFS